MGNLETEVIAGLIVVALSAIGGYLVRLYSAKDIRILPFSSHNTEKVDYSYLAGKWHFYYITRNPIDPDPIWIHAIRNLIVEKNKITGTTRMADHPSNELEYKTHSEITHGKMVITDYSVLEDAEFVYSIFTNLVRTDIIGIWMGFDGFGHQIAAPAIMCRTEKSCNELNELLDTSTVTIIPASLKNKKMYIKGKVVTKDQE